MEGAALIGLDTNVLLRLVLEDDPVQTPQAQAFVGALGLHMPGYVSLLVLCEFVWVLGRTHRYSRTQIASVVETVLNMEVLEVQKAELAGNALNQFRNSRADFGDCCIAALAEEAECTHTATFDKKAAKLPGMRLLI